MPFRGENIEVEFDFLQDLLVARTSEGETKTVRLENKTVADFYREYMAMFAELGVELRIHERPNELLDATPFSDDREHATYDAGAARRCWRILSSVDQVFKAFRGGFTGKSSPSHFWWGAFDLACTRFSGRPAPTHPGGIPNCPNYVSREAYSRECISAGWWPGTADGPVREPAFYAYGYPEPEGYASATIQPREASYNSDLKEWVLPYDCVRRAPNAESLVTQFLESTYDAAAKLAGWDVDGLRSDRAPSSTATPSTR
jgi:hypothetical protein